MLRRLTNCHIIIIIIKHTQNRHYTAVWDTGEFLSIQCTVWCPGWWKPMTALQRCSHSIGCCQLLTAASPLGWNGIKPTPTQSYNMWNWRLRSLITQRRQWQNDSSDHVTIVCMYVSMILTQSYNTWHWRLRSLITHRWQWRNDSSDHVTTVCKYDTVICPL